MCFRSDVIASVAYSPFCKSMIRRIGEANIDLIPSGTGDLVIEGIVQSSHICFVRFGYCNCNYILFTELTLANRQRRDLSVFKLSCHLPNCLSHRIVTFV